MISYQIIQIIQTLGDIMVPYGTPHDPHAQFGPDLPPRMLWYKDQQRSRTRPTHQHTFIYLYYGVAKTTPFFQWFWGTSHFEKRTTHNSTAAANRGRRAAQGVPNSLDRARGIR